MRPDCRKEQRSAAPARRSGAAAAKQARQKKPREAHCPQVELPPCRVFGPSTKRGSMQERFSGMDANGRQVFRLVGVKARTRPAFPFPLEQWQMAGALAHTAAVPHGIDYPFPFSFRQAEHLPFGFI